MILTHPRPSTPIFALRLFVSFILSPFLPLSQVTNSPFGGTLSLMVNHDRARSNGALWYYLTIDGTPVLSPQSWGDYLWDDTLNVRSPTPLKSLGPPFSHTSVITSQEFVYTTTTRVGQFFLIRQPYNVWYNYWLGGFLDTTGLSTGLHTLSVVFTANPTAASPTLFSDSISISVDNGWPLASINSILHYLDAYNLNNVTVVPTCGIVTGANDQFAFNITAEDPEQVWSVCERVN